MTGNNKKIFGICLMMVLIMVMLSFDVSAALTLSKPAASATISGVTVLNVTSAVTGPFNESNFTCKFYAKSASTANSSWVLIATSGNNSAGEGGATYTNTSFNSVVLEDSSDYIFNATCNNISSKAEVLNTGITVDNTKPQAPSSLSPATTTSITTSTTQTFSSTVTNANTTSCSYEISRGGATSGSDYITGTATYSASTCSFTKAFSSNTDNGEWFWYITASDGTNTTKSDLGGKIVVGLPGSGNGHSTTLADAAKAQSTSTNILTKPIFNLGNYAITLPVLIIAGWVLYLFTKKK